MTEFALTPAQQHLHDAVIHLHDYQFDVTDPRVTPDLRARACVIAGQVAELIREMTPKPTVTWHVPGVEVVTGRLQYEDEDRVVIECEGELEPLTRWKRVFGADRTDYTLRVVS